MAGAEIAPPWTWVATLLSSTQLVKDRLPPVTVIAPPELAWLSVSTEPVSARLPKLAMAPPLPPAVLPVRVQLSRLTEPPVARIAPPSPSGAWLSVSAQSVSDRLPPVTSTPPPEVALPWVMVRPERLTFPASMLNAPVRVLPSRVTPGTPGAGVIVRSSLIGNGLWREMGAVVAIRIVSG